MCRLKRLTPATKRKEASINAEFRLIFECCDRRPEAQTPQPSVLQPSVLKTSALIPKAPTINVSRVGDKSCEPI